MIRKQTKTRTKTKHQQNNKNHQHKATKHVGSACNATGVIEANSMIALTVKLLYACIQDTCDTELYYIHIFIYTHGIQRVPQPIVQHNITLPLQYALPICCIFACIHYRCIMAKHSMTNIYYTPLLKR